MASRTPPSEPISNPSSILYDVSWTLHRLRWPAQFTAVTSLLSRPQVASRARRAKQLKESLYIEDAGPEAELAFDEKAGLIREVRWEILEDVRDDEEDDDAETGLGAGRDGGGMGTGLVITLVYDAVRFMVVLYGAASEASSSAGPTLPLLLAKAPHALSQRITTFLSDTFDVRVAPLQLPELFLHETMEAYLGKLYQSVATLSTESRATFISATIQDLKIVLSFKPPVSPHLRTLDITIPTETVCNLLETAVAQKSQLMSVLVEHVERLTAMKIPVPGENKQQGDEAEQLVQISRTACHAFTLSGDGRLKMQKKACNAAEILNRGQVVQEANGMLLGRLLAHAARPDT